MGILRVILALSVFFAHTELKPDSVFVGGRVAVELFYMISGFLISYVLNSNENYKNTITFYESRALRIYPVYFVVALITLLALNIASPKFFFLYEDIPASAAVTLVLSNLFIFGQDIVMFLGIKGGELTFTSNFLNSDYLLFKGLLLPQAWTLGVELTFYLIAPFIVRSNIRIFSLMFLSAGVCLYLKAIGIRDIDPWSYRFFPAELYLFLIGAASQKIALPFWERQNEKKLFDLINALACCMMMILIVFYPYIHMAPSNKNTLVLAMLAIALPFLFSFQGKNKIDRAIGELSYPIYIGHILVLSCAEFLMRKLSVNNLTIKILVASLLVVVFALLLKVLIADNVEKIRHKVKRSKIMEVSTSYSN